MDGTVAAWDFRRLSDSEPTEPTKRCTVVRDPVAQLYMRDFSRQRHVYGPVLLGKATKLQDLFLGSSKSYEGIILLGHETNTDDVRSFLYFDVAVIFGSTLQNPGVDELCAFFLIPHAAGAYKTKSNLIAHMHTSTTAILLRKKLLHPLMFGWSKCNIVSLSIIKRMHGNNPIHNSPISL